MSTYSAYTVDAEYELNRIEPMTGIDETINKIDTIQTKLDEYGRRSQILNNNYNYIVDARDTIHTHPAYLTTPSIKKKETLVDVMYKDTVIQTHSNHAVLVVSGIAITSLLILSATR